MVPTRSRPTPCPGRRRGPGRRRRATMRCWRCSTRHDGDIGCEPRRRRHVLTGMWQRLAGVGLGLALGGVVFAQEAASPRFEVVSVKRNLSDDVASSLRPDANGVTGINVTPLRLVRVAYQVADFQVADAPGWFTSERYDITARAGEPVSMAQLGPMMQTLLAERFGLRIVQRRREST